MSVLLPTSDIYQLHLLMKLTSLHSQKETFFLLGKRILASDSHKIGIFQALAKIFADFFKLIIIFFMMPFDGYGVSV